nr:hypothetical protein [uncultured bacterium]
MLKTLAKGFAVGLVAATGVRISESYKPGFNERNEKWPMQSELDRLKITINPPQRIKPGKYDTFKAETDAEYQTRREAEAAEIRTNLQRLEGMDYYKKLSPREQEAEIRAAIREARETVRDDQPAHLRREEAAP